MEASRTFYLEDDDTPQVIEVEDYKLYADGLDVLYARLRMVEANSPPTNHDRGQVEPGENEELELDLTPGESAGLPDSLTLFLNQAARHIILTGQQERGLAQRIEAGDDEARKELILHNVRLAVAIAKKFRGRGVEFPDLIQEAIIGVDTAARKFDWRLGYKFSTYATGWVYQNLGRAIADKGSAIRIPVYMTEKMYAVFRAKQNLTTELRREPTNGEIAAELDITVDKLEEISGYDANQRNPKSLDQLIGEDADTELGEFQYDHSGDSDPELLAHQTLSRKALERALSKLPERERVIIENRYGLRDGRPRTFEEVGESMNLSRQRIQQLEIKSLSQLKNLNPGLRDLCY